MVGLFYSLIESRGRPGDLDICFLLYQVRIKFFFLRFYLVAVCVEAYGITDTVGAKLIILFIASGILQPSVAVPLCPYIYQVLGGIPSIQCILLLFWKEEALASSLRRHPGEARRATARM